MLPKSLEGDENRQEEIPPESFSQLLAFINNLEVICRPPPEVIFEEVYNLVNSVMPYDLNAAEKYENSVLLESGLDGYNQTRKVSLTNYFKLNRYDESKAVCKHQALLVSVLIEKLVENQILPNGTRVTRGSNIAYLKEDADGHAWTDIFLPRNVGEKERVFIIDVAQHIVGELVNLKTGSYINGKQCNLGGENDVWSDSKLWPYQRFNDGASPKHLQGAYSLVLENRQPDFLKTEQQRHLITRNTSVDKGYEWAGVGDAAVVVDWNKYYTSGYSELEKRLTFSIYKRVKEGDIVIKKYFYNDSSAESPEIKIQTAQSFSALYFFINELGTIRGSRLTYTPEQLIDLIDRVRIGKLHLDVITSSFGIRDKVEELLGQFVKP
ncbi:MAG: hypothetical protein WCK60_00275 [Candidatus Nomurabacteria bacterium]